MENFKKGSRQVERCLLRVVFMLIIFVGSSGGVLLGQGNGEGSVTHCEAEISEELFQAYVEDLRHFDYERINEMRSMEMVIPVKFVLVRRTNGTTDFSPAINLSTYEDAIENLNEEYLEGYPGGTGFTFEMCGEPTYIDSDYFYTLIESIDSSEVLEPLLQELAYNSSDAVVYSRYNGAPSGSGGSASQPCIEANSAGCPAETVDNMLFMLGRNSYLTSSIVHEFGHHLGLLHTYGTTDEYKYPAQVGQIDYPLNGTKNARELVIRTSDPDALHFNDPNCKNAGDFCCDTPATGLSGVGVFWPAAGQQGPYANEGISDILFSCDIEGTYVDYNLDAIFDQPGIQEVNRNFMGSGACKDHFTSDQLDRLLFYYDNRRKDQYELSRCDNFNDQVQFWDTPQIMREISIQTKHPNTYKLSNTFTTNDGNFSSTLYEDNLTADVRKTGDNGLDNYTWDNWKQSVNAYDIVVLSDYLTGQIPLNGYQILSGDVDRNDKIEIFDLIEMQKLILGINMEFSNHTAPWRFIPEYIPTNYPNDFHDSNPFLMMIDGISTNGTASYIESDWEYQINNGNSGQNGFHGYKVGDINGNSQIFPGPDCHPAELVVNADQLLLDGETYEIGLSINQSALLEGFQLSTDLHPNVQINKTSSILPGFNELNNTNTILHNGTTELRMLWYSSNGISSSSLEYQFTITATMIGDTYLSEIFDPQENGNLLISDISDCAISSLLNVVIIPESTERDVVAESELSRNRLEFYPNPTSDKLHFRTSESSKIELIKVDLYNYLGQLVLSEKIELSTGSGSINLSKLPTGAYFIKAIFAESSYSQSIIIE